MEKLPKWNKQHSRKCCSSWHAVCKHLKFLWVYCLHGLLKAKVPNEDLLGLHSFIRTFTICCAWPALTLQICNTLDQCFWEYWIKLTFFYSRKTTTFLKEVAVIRKMASFILLTLYVLKPVQFGLCLPFEKTVCCTSVMYCYQGRQQDISRG